jgi:ABC-type Fe3+/spermidine/putrescine transport system ATPase subunit
VRRLGATAIFVTHDQEEAMILSDVVAVMNAGRIEQVDDPAGVFERPRTRFVADFMGMGNVLAVEAGASGSLRHGGIELRAESTAPAPPRHVAIRAERVALAPATGAPSAENTAEGTLLDAVYHGSLTTGRVRLDAAPVTTMLVRQASAAQDGAGWKVGARVRLSWAASAVRMLEE